METLGEVLFLASQGSALGLYTPTSTSCLHVAFTLLCISLKGHLSLDLGAMHKIQDDVTSRSLITYAKTLFFTFTNKGNSQGSGHRNIFFRDHHSTHYKHQSVFPYPMVKN